MTYDAHQNIQLVKALLGNNRERSVGDPFTQLFEAGGRMRVPPLQEFRSPCLPVFQRSGVRAQSALFLVTLNSGALELVCIATDAQRLFLELNLSGGRSAEAEEMAFAWYAGFDWCADDLDV